MQTMSYSTNGRLVKVHQKGWRVTVKTANQGLVVHDVDTEEEANTLRMKMNKKVTTISARMKRRFF